MTPGLPGAGIGGLFYLIAALCTPLWEAVRALRKNRSPRRWAVVFRHFVLAVSILAAMGLMAWTIAVIVSPSPGVDPHVGLPAIAAIPEAIGRRMALFTLTTLAVVLTAVEILRLLCLLLNRTRRLHRQPNPAPRITPADDTVLRAMSGDR